MLAIQSAWSILLYTQLFALLDRGFRRHDEASLQGEQAAVSGDRANKTRVTYTYECGDEHGRRAEPPGASLPFLAIEPHVSQKPFGFFDRSSEPRAILRSTSVHSGIGKLIQRFIGADLDALRQEVLSERELP